MITARRPQTALFRAPFWKRAGRRMLNDWQIYVLLAAAVTYFFFYNYMPLYGIQIAFKDFKAALGIEGSKWVGFKHFSDFFHAYYFPRLMLDTFLLNAYGLLLGFPIPIILAILMNQLEWRPMKKFTQTAIYVPHFVSTVVMAGILYLFLSPRTGIVNIILGKLSGNPDS
jgi:putative aldouronate transport system permease protein